MKWYFPFKNQMCPKGHIKTGIILNLNGRFGQKFCLVCHRKQEADRIKK